MVLLGSGLKLLSLRDDERYRWLSDHDTCPLCVQVVTQSIRIDK
jgi:hypothetical protein